MGSDSRALAFFITACVLLAAGCSAGPAPSHVAAGYRGKLPDDTLVEASTTLLLTTAPAVMAIDCKPLAGASDDAVDRAVAAGTAARLPQGVTIYTPPFSADNPQTAPFVVTDDKYAGTLCTPNAYKVLKT
ncbi:MAG: hypothetical protein JO199_09605 [Candidatus Eremiobacteraeota bacterium]|nr:hypothetical protein [Candidatus Eremiobacteraeota bacterium]